jgi:hypothetical protein
MNTLTPWKWGKKNVPVKREDSQPESTSLLSLQRDMNRIFESFFQAFESQPVGSSGDLTSGIFQPVISVLY